MPSKIVDCFIFYNELNMLKFRLEELYDVVDYFVIVEASRTFAGNSKELVFENNKHLYSKYQDKIIHIVIDDMPDGDDAWGREKHQRNAIDRGISLLKLDDNDIITITDLDEIYSKEFLKDIKNYALQNNVYTAGFDMYYYHLECKGKLKWHFPKFLNYWTYVNVCNRQSDSIRNWGNTITIDGNIGWHFSYFGDVNFIKNKIQNFSHQELNNDTYLNDEKIIEQIRKCDDLFFRDNEKTHQFHYCSLKDNNFIPDNYQMLLQYRELYA